MVARSGLDYAPLEAKIHYHFRDKTLLAQCLFHASATEGRQIKPGRDFQRLEFLGDRVLGLNVAELLLATYREEDEGHIARRHSSLVDGRTLAIIAADIGLGDWITLSRGEQKAEGNHSATILADCLESLLGAIYLDGGWKAAQKTVTLLWQKPLSRQGKEPPLNPKSALQEFLQARGQPVPEYRITRITDSKEPSLFEAELHIPGFQPVCARGASKRVATTQVAQAMLDLLKSPDKGLNARPSD